MRTSLYTLLLVTASLSLAAAQTEKGRWTVGTQVGSLTYLDQGTSHYKSFSASLTPLAGYFIANGLLLGTGVPLSFSRQTSSGLTNKYTTSGIGLSPFVRYYFGPSVLKPYVGLSYSYVRNNSNYKTQLGDVSGKGYSSSLTPTVGITYFLNRNVALNAGLNYTILTSETPYVYFSSQPTATIINSKSDYKSLSLSIGFQLFFGK